MTSKPESITVSPFPAMEIVSLEAELVCDACRGIDFTAAFDRLKTNPSRWDGYIVDKDATRLTTSRSSQCPLCTLLKDANLLKGQETIEPCLRAFSYLHNARGVMPRTIGAQDSVILAVNETSELCLVGGDGHGKKDMAICYPRGQKPGLLKPQVVAATFDPGRARSWINNCKEHHSARCTGKSLSPVVPGMKLIDCETRQVKLADSTMQWVALSYVWGRQTTRSYAVNSGNHQLPDQMPATVKDAVTVTKLLGYRYLWIDKYCIDQNDPDEFGNQIQSMDRIYRGSEVTIIAAAGTDDDYGLPGVDLPRSAKQSVFHFGDMTFMTTGPEPMQHVEDESCWWTRGWTLQEGLLSRRRLIFSEHQVSFECQRAAWTEALGGLECMEHPGSVDWSRWKNGIFLLSYLMGNPEPQVEIDGLLNTRRTVHESVVPRLHDVFRLIQQYTTRQLTFDVDSLNAVTGILQAFAKRRNPTLHLVGLPYVPLEGSEKLVESYVFAVLAWYHKSGVEPRRRQKGFPSWTWARWAGAIRWMCYPSLPRSDMLPKFRAVQCESDDGVPVPASEYLRMRESLDECPDSAVAIHFEARQVPHQLFLDGGENQEDWSKVIVGGNHLFTKYTPHPPTKTPHEFIELLKDGTWACLILGDYQSPYDSICYRFLLVVEWQRNGSASRSGALVIESRADATTQTVGLFEESELPWSSVRLI